jgi:predicted RNase H-like HicB family nuclease
MSYITINLRGRELDDGRFYVDSEELEGFHYLLDAGEDPEAMTPTLQEFVQLYVKAEITKITRAQTPKGFRQRASHAPDRKRELAFVAEVAQAA